MSKVQFCIICSDDATEVINGQYVCSDCKKLHFT